MPRRIAHRGACLTASLIAGTTFVACSTSNQQPTAAALSRPQLQAKATAICGPASKQIEQAAKKYLGNGQPNAKEFERFVNAAVVPDTQQTIDAFRKLTPPSASTRDYALWLDELQSVTDRLSTNPRLMMQGADPFADSNRMAKRLGLDACVSD